MKKIFMMLTIGSFSLVVGIRGMAQETEFRLIGMGSLEVPVTPGKMTNLIFPVDVLTGVKVSKGIIAQKVKGVENVIELKAAKRNFPITNLSVYGKNGRLYSFVLRYTEDTSVLNFRVVDVGNAGESLGRVSDDVPAQGLHPIHLAGLPADMTTLAGDANRLAIRKRFLHVSVRRERMRVSLEGIYLRDNLEWMVFRLVNKSLIAYNPTFIRFYTEDRKKVKRKAIQQMTLTPVYGGCLESVVGDMAKSFATAFGPFTVAEDKRLVVEISEPEGGRVLVLKVRSKTLLKARRG